MDIPGDLRYAKTHEWIKLNKNIVRVGISDFAQHELTDIVFVELPAQDAEVSAGSQCAVVESVKTAADVYAPVSGRVIRINDKVVEAPELLNHNSYGDGWLFEVEMNDASQWDNLLTADEYKESLESK